MTATRVPDELTPLWTDALIAALAEGYTLAMRSQPTAGCLAVLMSQVCLETGNGKKIHNHNWGNVKRAADWEGLYCSYKCDEIFDADVAREALRRGPCTVSPWRDTGMKRVVLFPEHPWAEFRAFATAADGAAQYVEFLSCRERYQPAWSRAYHGDASGFSHALRVAGYYTADEVTYTRGICSIAARVLPACQRVMEAAAHGLSAEDIARINGLVGDTIASSVIWNSERHHDASGASDTEPAPPLEA